MDEIVKIVEWVNGSSTVEPDYKGAKFNDYAKTLEGNKAAGQRFRKAIKEVTNICAKLRKETLNVR